MNLIYSKKKKKKNLKIKIEKNTIPLEIPIIILMAPSIVNFAFENNKCNKLPFE